MDFAECQAEWTYEINRHEKIVLVSLALTAVKLIVWTACKNNPNLGKFNIVAGCIKIFLAVSLWTYLYPKCPDGCYCGDYLSIYPFIALFLGILWIYQGYAVQQQRAQEEPHQSAIEVTMTENESIRINEKTETNSIV